VYVFWFDCKLPTFFHECCGPTHQFNYLIDSTMKHTETFITTKIRSPIFF